MALKAILDWTNQSFIFTLDVIRVALNYSMSDNDNVILQSKFFEGDHTYSGCGG